MRNVAWIGLIALTLSGIHSPVYACDHAAKVSAVVVCTPEAPEAPAATATAPEHTPLPGGKWQHLSPALTFEVDTSDPASARVYHFIATGKPADRSHPVVRTAKAAMTLGRAIKTTVEALMGTLVSAAAEKTAELV